MATQSLYRRYRPRRFGEVKGQEHVVRALRNAVINHREGQAYLFSGPRGTGKTTSARILAKVLNCANPTDGEPCCECESCLAVERGTSYDVHELDAASNNGVDAMRDLIEKASLGTPGRHKVYILDEVHMLSKAAEAALLKTLEEPPPHVVFVLATTDPQKVSDTIRSRTQHLQFHLLPMDVMEDHIRWLAGDAGIDLTDDALQSVLRQGGGSARDTVSALELVASGGGEPLETTPLDEFVEAFIEHDPGRALTVVALAVQQGRDPRTLTDDIVRHLRDCFLSLMAPELVQLPTQRAAEVADLAHRLGAANAVRAMERLGEMLVEMRHAPDPRLLLEVALVQLTHQAASNDVSALLDRLDKLEQQVASGVAAAPAPRPAPVDPATGRAALGGRARPPAAAPAAAPAPAPTAAPAAAPPAAAAPPPAAPAAADTTPPPAPTPAPTPASAPAAPVAPAASGNLVADAAARWATEIKPKLKGLARALYSNTTLLGERNGAFALGVANDATRQKCDDHRADVEAAIASVVGGKVSVLLVIHTGAGDHDDEVDAGNNVVPLARPAAPAPPPPADEDVDLDDLVDAPPESVVSPLDRLTQAFPGSQLVDE
jgi:DNA polymerase-3 subunit gamma/tau